MEFIQTFLNNDAVGYILARMLLIVIATFLVTRLINHFVRRVINGKIHQRFLYNALIVLLWMIGVMTALTQIPSFNKGFSTLLAGSGIAALSIGLAAQESLGNVINGMVISISKPFEVGDHIRLVEGNITGYVEDISLRHTVIRTFMNSRIIVPNSTINKDMIENSTYWNVKASGFVDVIVTYGSDIDRASKLIAEIIASHPDFIDTRTPEQQDAPKVKVFVRALSLYGVELRASMWTESINNNFGACSDARRSIIRAFEAEQIQLAHSNLIAPR